jgi:Transposase DDE domain
MRWPAMALVGALDGGELEPAVDKAARLLATVVGQDLDETDGVFRIARQVARDRVISTVDPDARHGHKTSARGFDGYKGHLAIDPDSEIVTATTVTAANSGDADPAEQLLAVDLPEPADRGGHRDEPPDRDAAAGTVHRGMPHSAVSGGGGEVDAKNGVAHQLAVYGDAAYGAGRLLAWLEDAGTRIMTKVQPPPALGGRFAKDRFDIDLTAGTVTCPAQVSVPIRPAKGGGGTAAFGTACTACLLASQCTPSATGRVITIGAYEQQLARARAAQSNPAWRADYTATRPKVERKIGHLMRRRHGGRRARVRGTPRLLPTSPCSPRRSTWPVSAGLGLHRVSRQGWQVAPA